MHKVFCVPELVVQIVNSIDANDIVTTYALARTCQALLEPSLDKLWHNASLWDLAVLMPQHVWTSTEHRVVFSPRRARSLTILVFSSSFLRKGDWIGSRFRCYARRLREVHPKDLYCLVSPSGNQRRVDPVVVAAWNEEFSGNILFPRVTQLALRDYQIKFGSTSDYLDATRTFLNANILHLSLDLGQDPKGLCGSFLPFVSSLCPNLDTLELGFNFSVRHETPTTTWSSALYNLLYLRNLTLQSVVLTDEILERLVALPSLQHLICRNVRLSPDLTIISTPLFSKLVEFRCYRPLGMLTVLPDWLFALWPCLEIFQIQFAGQSIMSNNHHRFTTAELLRITQNLSKFTKLSVLSFKFAEATALEGLTETLSLDTSSAILTPILSCPKLRVLEIATFTTFTIDDALVRSMAHAWPGLAILNILQAPSPLITFDTFFYLLQACPQLVNPNLWVDCSSQISSNPRDLQRLTKVHFGGVSPLENDSFCDTIRCVFPFLNTICFPNDVGLESWTEQLVSQIFPNWVVFVKDNICCYVLSSE